jgi:alginate O-acetyltransferase complex protein AlgI
MLFSSISFLYYFLPAVLILYFLSPWKMKNIVLLVASLIFYFCGEPAYSVLMVASIISGYLHGLWIDRARGSRYAKIPLISSVVFSIGLLMFFKYTDFFITNINWAFKINIPLTHILLPIGISFYTFQILSYTIDVYRGQARVQKSIIKFAAYVSLFPQLIAGPIVRYTTVEEELDQRTHSFADAAYGINRFIFGLAKKIIIANTLGELVEIFKDTGSRRLPSCSRYILTSRLTVIWPLAWEGYSGSISSRISIILSYLRPYRSSGADGICPWGPGSVIMFMCLWEVTA